MTTLGALAGAPAFADEPPPPAPPDKPSSFGADPAPAPLPVVAPGDYKGLLQNCDIERARAVAERKMIEKDERAVPFIGGAYLALWAVLMVFFIVVAARQKRLRAEMMVLRERLARLGDDAR